MRVLYSDFINFLIHPILQFLILPSWAQGPDSAHKIKHKITETAVLGGNVTIFCNLTSMEDVVQITWQKIQNSLPQNIGTYSSKYGENILPPYVDRLHCKAIEPNSSFITIHEVTFDDEACYKCLFNVFPSGSHGGQICLNIFTVPELKTELQDNLDSADFVKFIYSAVGKPAPQITLFPTQLLMNLSEEYQALNPNGVVTVRRKYKISVETVKSLSLQHLIVKMDHPLKHEEKIITLPLKQERLPDSSPIWSVGVAVFIGGGLLLSLLVIFGWRKKNKNKTNEKNGNYTPDDTEQGTPLNSMTGTSK